jgi:hypothetical protein
VYCDLQSGRPARIPAELQLAFRNGAPTVALPRAESLFAAGSGGPVTFELAVQPSHLDHVTHVNNAVYASFLEDGSFALFAGLGWPLTRMLAAGGALRVRRLDYEYLSDAVVGEHLMVHSWLLDDTPRTVSVDDPPTSATLVQVINRANGREILRARSDWVWRRKPPVIGSVPDA